MSRKSLNRSFLFLSATLFCFVAGLAEAQVATEVDIGREEVQLRTDIRVAIDRDTDVANTALVFHNSGRTRTKVVCVAYDGNGEVLGRGMTTVPSNGVRYLRASDLSDGVDFVGSAVCKSRHRIVGSAVFLAPGAITDLTVQQRRMTHVRFPLVASY